MADWRRERDTPTVHIAIDGVGGTLCEALDRDQLGDVLYEAVEAAPNLCALCRNRLAEATDLSEHFVATAVEPRRIDRAELAKASLRRLIQMVPAGLTKDDLIYARACIVRGDPKGATEAIRTWHANMRAVGVFEGIE